jgi:hypothetical protein
MDTSEWARVQVVQSTIGGLTQRTTEALRDAFEANPYRVHDVASSDFIGVGTRAIPLPPRVSEVIRVTLQKGTELADGIELKHWRFEAQSQTPRLHLDDVCAASTPLNIHYVHVPERLPIADLKAVEAIAVGATEVYSTGVPDPTSFVYPGYLELYAPSANTAAREVVRYEGVSGSGFTGLVRGIQGHQRAWASGTGISYVVEMPSGVKGVVGRHAQATLFEYLMQDRQLYPIYKAVAAERATPPEELAAMVGLFRQLAREDRRQTKKRPQTQNRGTRRRRI